MKTRYIADWIIDMDDMGADKAAQSTHLTFDDALKAAVRESKKAGCIEWVRVREQEFVSGRDSCGKWDRWETVRKWTGDWDQVEEVT